MDDHPSQDQGVTRQPGVFPGISDPIGRKSGELGRRYWRMRVACTVCVYPEELDTQIRFLNISNHTDFCLLWLMLILETF